MCSNACEGMCELTAQIDGYFNLYAQLKLNLLD